MLLKYCRSLLLIISLFLIHLIAINLLPPPFNNINLIFLYLLWQIIRDNQLPIGHTLILTLLLELFSSTPFSVNLLIYPISLVILFWLLKNILTNRSFYAIVVITALGLIIFRLIFYLTLTILNIFISSLFILNREIIIITGWEILFNCVLSALIYLVNYKILNKLNPVFLKKIGY